jgi:predicted dehydrogenase
MMNIALVGCGYVADYYVQSAKLHPEIKIVGIFDRDAARLAHFSKFYKIERCYGALGELLSDAEVDIVLNLTNPREHFSVSLACLQAGKHVYSEKPLAVEFEEAKELVAEAERRGLLIVSAPCSLLGEAAQTIWQALRSGFVGEPRLVYANIDDGTPFKVFGKPFGLTDDIWGSRSGAPWPAQDEFEVGVALEHAGYVVTWLAAFFGPARTVTTVAANLFPDKIDGVDLQPRAADAVLSIITFASGVVARVNCTIVADDDRSFVIYGTQRTLICDDVWNFGARIYSLRPAPRARGLGRKVVNRVHKILRHTWPRALQVNYPLVRKAAWHPFQGNAQMDYMLGPLELAAAVREGRPARLSPRFCLHVNEVVLAMSNGSPAGSVYEVTSTFDPIAEGAAGG